MEMYSTPVIERSLRCTHQHQISLAKHMYIRMYIPQYNSKNESQNILIQVNFEINRHELLLSNTQSQKSYFS